MLVVRGRSVEEVDRAWVEAQVAEAAVVAIDVGTGDGRFAAALARDHPDWFVVGIDPSRAALEERSRRALAKPAKGGVANLALVVASIEAAPPELAGRADALSVLLPWGRLLAGTIRPDADVLAGLRSLVAPGAALRLVFNASPWEASTPKPLVDLPAVTVEHVDRVLAPAYRTIGCDLAPARWMPDDEARQMPTTWSRRLAAGSGRRFVEVFGEFPAGAG